MPFRSELACAHPHLGLLALALTGLVLSAALTSGIEAIVLRGVVI
jgi:hypothetical protein